MKDEPCTPEQRQAIIDKAEDRRGYILWLANYLERTDDLLIRQDAARELRQLVGEE